MTQSAKSSTPRYAPPNGDGEKPYVATISEWGRKREEIVYADKPGDAKYRAIGRMRYVSATVRRATPDDMSRLGA